MKVKLLCPYCKSDNIVRDAYAAWDVKKQDWVLRTYFDEMFCEVCGAEFSCADEVPLETNPKE